MDDVINNEFPEKEVLQIAFMLSSGRNIKQ